MKNIFLFKIKDIFSKFKVDLEIETGEVMQVAYSGYVFVILALLCLFI